MTKDYLTSPFNDKQLQQLRTFEKKVTKSPAAQFLLNNQNIARMLQTNTNILSVLPSVSSQMSSNFKQNTLAMRSVGTIVRDYYKDNGFAQMHEMTKSYADY